MSKPKPKPINDQVSASFIKIVQSGHDVAEVADEMLRIAALMQESIRGARVTSGGLIRAVHFFAKRAADRTANDGSAKH
jgi:hypothetical protein